MGLETEEQLALAGEKPDVLIGCVGGGSNFAGLILPFVPDKLAGQSIRFLGAEPQACPTLTRGQYRYDYGDVARQTPLLKMHTLGHNFFPPPIHAGGLRYPGMLPFFAIWSAWDWWTRRHTIKLKSSKRHSSSSRRKASCRPPRHPMPSRPPWTSPGKRPPGTVIVFLYSGHGLLDLAAYDAYLRGGLADEAYPDERIQVALESCPNIGF